MPSPAKSRVDGESPRLAEPAGRDDRRFGAILLGWMILMVLLQALRWAAGLPAADLASGVEEGASRAESRVRGEVGDEIIRKAIRSQRETLPFWAVVAALGDFLIEPVSLAVRAILVATIFTGLAAFLGRQPNYDQGLRDSSRAQGLWVMGLATRLTLAVLLHRGEADVETSAALFLAPGRHPAALWLSLRQADLFAVAGWTLLGLRAVRRGESPGWLACGVCLILAASEACLRVVLALATGGAIRLSLLVE